MLKVIKVLFAAATIFAVSPALLNAQNSTNSPYTRYGFGSIADRSFGAGRSMGGVGFGLRSSRQINPMNPASYSSMDSLTFLFDAGVSAHSSWYNEGKNRQQNLNGNFEYAAMQFPLHDRIAMSIGLLPYSSVGYDFYSIGTSQDNISYNEHFTGTGGLNEVYGGLSLDIWKKRLSVGANIGYLFGSIQHLNNVSDISIYRMRKVKVDNLKYDFGVQYTHPLSKTERITAGLTFSPKLRLRTTAYDLVSNSLYFQVISEGDTIRNGGFDIPNSYGAGISYTKDNKMILAADVSMQEWSKAAFFGKTSGYDNRLKVALGAEYIPNNFTRSYLHRVRYRAGLHYNNSYVKIKEAGFNEIGATIGFGFPVLDNRSFINASFEYVRVMPNSKTLIGEQYLRLTVSYTFNEYWFFKRKVD